MILSLTNSTVHKTKGPKTIRKGPGQKQEKGALKVMCHSKVSNKGRNKNEPNMKEPLPKAGTGHGRRGGGEQEA